jgi:hypothetical protein
MQLGILDGIILGPTRTDQTLWLSDCKRPKDVSKKILKKIDNINQINLDHIKLFQLYINGLFD